MRATREPSSLRPGLHVTQLLLGEVMCVVGDGEMAVSDGLGVSERMADGEGHVYGSSTEYTGFA